MPVLLPYHTALDYKSWWMSQALLHWYSAYCLRDAIVYSSLIISSVRSSHASYPQGFASRDELSAVLRAEVPEIAELLIPTNTSNRVNPFYGWEAKKVMWAPHVSASDVPLWQSTEPFKKCHETRHPNFVAVLGAGIPEAPEGPCCGPQPAWESSNFF